MKKLTTIIIIVLVVSVLIYNRKNIENFLDYKNMESEGTLLQTYPTKVPPRLFVDGNPVGGHAGFTESSVFLNLPDSEVSSKLKLNKELEFIINNDHLGYSISDYNAATFLWDFGDGSRTIGGPAVTHQYSQEGSYIVSIGLLGTGDVTEEKTAKAYLNQITYAKVHIAVVEDFSRKLPDAELFGLINPLIPSGKYMQVVFDGSHSKGEGNLKYFMDYGDGLFSEYATSVHTFDKGSGVKKVILHVTDSHNFFSVENTTIYAKEEKNIGLIAQYKYAVFSYLEGYLNRAFSGYMQGKVSNFKFLTSIIILGFMQLVVTPLLSVFVLIFGFRRSKIAKREYLRFFYVKSLFQILLALGLSIATTYTISGLIISEILAQVLLVIGILFLINIFLIVFADVKKRMNPSALGVTLGMLPYPFAFTVFALANYSMDFFHAVYFLVMLIVGNTVANMFLLFLGSKLSASLQK